MEEENKYHFAREIIFNLRACHAITDKVYSHWIDKLINDEKQAKNNEVLDLVSESSINELLTELHNDAEKEDSYCYGLPTYGHPLSDMIATVRTWVKSYSS